MEKYEENSVIKSAIISYFFDGLSSRTSHLKTTETKGTEETEETEETTEKLGYHFFSAVIILSAVTAVTDLTAPPIKNRYQKFFKKSLLKIWNCGIMPIYLQCISYVVHYKS